MTTERIEQMGQKERTWWFDRLTTQKQSEADAINKGNK